METRIVDASAWPVIQKESELTGLSPFALERALLWIHQRQWPVSARDVIAVEAPMYLNQGLRAVGLREDMERRPLLPSTEHRIAELFMEAGRLRAWLPVQFRDFVDEMEEYFGIEME